MQIVDPEDKCPWCGLHQRQEDGCPNLATITARIVREETEEDDELEDDAPLPWTVERDHRALWGVERYLLYHGDEIVAERLEKADAVLLVHAAEMAEVLREVSEYLDQRADINQGGSANEAMLLGERVDALLGVVGK